jgi:hypothetical protein
MRATRRKARSSAATTCSDPIHPRISTLLT